MILKKGGGQQPHSHLCGGLLNKAAKSYDSLKGKKTTTTAYLLKTITQENIFGQTQAKIKRQCLEKNKSLLSASLYKSSILWR